MNNTNRNNRPLRGCSLLLLLSTLTLSTIN